MYDLELFFNSLLVNGTICSLIVKISFFKIKGIIEKISYERCAYESVDENSLYLKNQRKKELMQQRVNNTSMGKTVLIGYHYWIFSVNGQE